MPVQEKYLFHAANVVIILNNHSSQAGLILTKN